MELLVALDPTAPDPLHTQLERSLRDLERPRTPG
jgi:hypothetical protein